MTQRQTIVVHSLLAADQARPEAARNGHHGVQVTSVVGMAARLAIGFLRDVDGHTLSIAVGTVLREAAAGTLGDLEPIRGLPGLQLALTRTAEQGVASRSRPRGPEPPSMRTLPPLLRSRRRCAAICQPGCCAQQTSALRPACACGMLPLFLARSGCRA